MRKLKTKLSSVSYREKLDYILTVCLYCWMLMISRTRIALQNGVFHVMRGIVLIILPKSCLNKFDRNRANGQEALDHMFGNMEYGDDIMTAKTMVLHTCCCYLALPVAVVACIICSIIGWDMVSTWVIEGIGGSIIPLILWGLIFFYACRIRKTSCDALFYLPKFKEFEKRDEEWLQKWKRYSLLIFAGSFVAFLMCMGVCELFITLF